jgi:CheY-like chemotaxis protein
MAHIFVVEDSQELSEILRDLLIFNGHAVTTFEDAEGVIAWTQDSSNQPPALIFCDHNLGAMTGMELLAHLRDDSRYVALPFVLITGEEDTSKLTQGATHTPSAILKKPFVINHILQLTEKLLNA